MEKSSGSKKQRRTAGWEDGLSWNYNHKTPDGTEPVEERFLIRVRVAK